jgi:hypothetical protein
VKEGHLAVPKDALDFRVEFIRPAFYWIEEVYSTEYTGYKRIRDLCTEEIWSRYFLWAPDFDDHREMVLLRKAASGLRKRVVARSRPDFFKKGKINEQVKIKKRADSARSKAESSK